MATVTLHVRVKPKSAREEVLNTADGLLVRVTAPPVEGAANTAVIKALAAALNIPKSSISITGGASGRLKRVSIANFSEADVQARIAALPVGA